MGEINLLATSLCGVITFLLVFKFYFMKAAKCQSNARIDGKTVIITGANTGIGLETAKELAKRGGHIILACRDAGRAERAAVHIIQTVPDTHIVIKLLDLASLQSIRRFVEDIKMSEYHVDILINNAGVGGISYQFTEDGFEKTFGVNHLGHFLLTLLLKDQLMEAAPSRVINVSAHAHTVAKLDFNDLMMEKDYGPIKAYCRSKLANIMFTQELAKRWQGTGVTAYALHPGVVKTELLRYLWISRIPGLAWCINTLCAVFLKSAKEGSQTTVYCAVDEGLAHQSGLYYSNCALSTPTMTALNEDSCKTLWDKSIQLVGLDMDDDLSGHDEQSDS